MRVSQRLDYAMRAAVELARRPPGRFASGGELAARLGLPQRVVEQQLSALTRAGILVSRPGAGGGHALARPAGEITAADVVAAVQGPSLDVPRAGGSAVTELWADAAGALDAAFAARTLADLARRQSELDAAAATHYVI